MFAYPRTLPALLLVSVDRDCGGKRKVLTA